MSVVQTAMCVYMLVDTWRLDRCVAEVQRLPVEVPHQVERIRREQKLGQEATAAEIRLSNGRSALVCFTYTEGILFLFWAYMAHRNLDLLGRRELKHEPTSTIAWWLVPVANLWMPCRVLCEIWKASNPDAASDDGGSWRRGRSTYVIFVWWLLLWASWVAAWTVSPVKRPDALASPAAFHQFALGFSLDMLLTVAANVPQVVWIVGAIRRQNALYRRLTMAAVAHAAEVESRLSGGDGPGELGRVE